MFAMLLDGFRTIFSTPSVLLTCFAGCILGTFIGALPGIGSATGVAVLLPLIYGKDPLTSLVMLSGIFSGTMFGGAISSITLNIPGTSAAAATTFDGYPLARSGQAGKAIGMSAIASFLGGTIATILLCCVGIPLSKFALKFGPPEYFAVYLLTFVVILTLTEANFLKTCIALIFGLLLSTVGADPITGAGRLTFGSVELLSGIDYLPAIIGLFGMSEVLINLSKPNDGSVIDCGSPYTRYSLKNILPSFHDIRFCLPSILRQGLFGFIIGALPGAGASIATMAGYSLEKRFLKDSENFGKGDIRGVAAPESADNGSAIGSYVPLLSLGIPGSATSALLLGAFVILGIQPGPLLFTEHPDVVGGLIASMYVGNVVLLIINTAFIPLFVVLLDKSKKIISVVVSCFCIIGVYALRNSMFDVLLMIAFAGIGVFFKVIGIPIAPTVIALVLGSDLEHSFRQTLQMTRGQFGAVFSRPLFVILFILSVIFVVMPAVKKITQTRKKRLGSASDTGSDTEP